jgi:outer membrane biosynthesis protein TonB
MDKRAYIFSAVLHVTALLLLLVNIPFLRSKSLTMPPVIPIEVVSISALTQSPPKRDQHKEEVAKTKLETHKAAQKKPAPTPEPEKQEPLPKVQHDKVAPKPTLVPTPKPESKPVEKKSEAKALKNDLKPKEKPDTKKEKGKKASKAEDDFMSILQAVNEVKKSNPSSHATEEKAIDSENIADKLSLSELDALRQQLQRCWNVPAGALNTKDLAVDIRVTMGPDAIVKQADILDASRMHRDAYFRTAAESAKRALFSPECTPLKLPKNSYAQWQTFVITFNPKDLV